MRGNNEKRGKIVGINWKIEIGKKKKKNFNDNSKKKMSIKRHIASTSSPRFYEQRKHDSASARIKADNASFIKNHGDRKSL